MKSLLAAVVAMSILLGAAVPAQTTARSADVGVGYAQTGDQVRITVWPQSAFGAPVTATVDIAGSIILPQIGRLNVSTIPIKSLRDTLGARLAKFIREPEVDVQVLRRVTVNGAVMKPDVYFVDMAATLRDAVARAGGITEVANRKKVSIIRNGVESRVSNWETDATPASILQSGDQVMVGRRSWLEINILPIASLSLATASFLLSLRR